MTSTRVGKACLLAALMAWAAAPAAAQEQERGGDYSLTYAARPLTMPGALLRVDGGIAHVKIAVSGPFGDASASTTSLLVGLGYGVTDDLEVGASALGVGTAPWIPGGLLPLMLDPEVDLRDPALYGRYRLVRGDMEAAADVRLVIPVQGDFALVGGLPVRYHMDDLALDTGLWLQMAFGDATVATLSIPLMPRFNVTPELYLGADTGFVLQFLDGSGWRIPLGVEMGYAVAVGAQPLDVLFRFGFPVFLAEGGDGVTTNIWEMLVGARFHTGVGG